MNRILPIILLFCSLNGLSQVNKPKPTLENLQKRHRYMQSKDYKGPKTESYKNPSSMDETTYSDDEASSGGGTISYSPQDIERNRKNKRQGQKASQGGGSGSGSGGGGKGSGGSGTKPNDPEMGKPQPIEFDTEESDVDIDPVDDVSVNPFVWKLIMVILILGLVFVIAYYIIKNYRPRNRKLLARFTPEELNPEEISKTDLELRLEEALLREDYRECVRIYFTFILKEMIRLRRIRWKSDSTNRDYVHQARKYDPARTFEETVRIYDLVWYGEYAIQKAHYLKLEEHLSNYYKQLSSENA